MKYKIYFLTTRFNNTTWEENQKFVERKKVKNSDIKCIYGSPIPIKNTIEDNARLLMCEMNNETNKIMGIGLIKNNSSSLRSFGVYGDGNFNRYIYTGKHRLSREILETYDKELIEWLEELLFKGKSHLKRGNGFMEVSNKKITDDIKIRIKNAFSDYYRKCKRNV